MVELRRHLGFLLEAFDDMLVHRDVGRQYFDRDFALERQVVGEKDRAHPPLTEQALDLVLPLHQPLQPLHQAFGCAGARAHRAATSHVGTARVAELAPIRQRRVALETLHHGACPAAGHGAWIRTSAGAATLLLTRVRAGRGAEGNGTHPLEEMQTAYWTGTPWKSTTTR